MKHNPAFVQLVAQARDHVRECNVESLKGKLEEHPDLVLIDVREDHEVVTGMIPRAYHLGKGILERDIESTIPDKSATVFLYCGGGYRSVLAAESIQKMGYTNVWSVEGGIKSWKEAGYTLSFPSAKETT